jgi:arsenite-transporting ATPase
MTSSELDALGFKNQLLAVNGRFHARDPTDALAIAIERDQTEALAAMPASLASLPQDEIPLVGFDVVGIAALRALLASSNPPPLAAAGQSFEPVDLPGLNQLVDNLARAGRGLIMIMGKGGVGKTTIASAIAVGLLARGHIVHLSTTDPAAHLSFVVNSEVPGLTVDRIDPKVETERYIAKIMATRGRYLDEQGKALLREDLASPCTEEVAVFHAFSRVVAGARSAFVVLDTAPTGHTLLLLDATGAYHRQIKRQLEASNAGRVVTPLMRLQDAAYTRVILVTLPETTPVSEAAALQDDLRRARIEPFAWVINKSLAGTETHDPLLRLRLARESPQIDRVRNGLATRSYILGLRTKSPVGLDELRALT